MSVSKCLCEIRGTLKLARVDTPAATAALCKAVKFGGENAHEAVQMLLEAHVSPTTPDAEGKTPLYHAVHSKQPKQVELLLEFRADPNHVDECGPSLYCAARHNMRDV